MSTEPTTRLILFGGATLEGERGPIAGRSAQRRRLALLALLAVSRRALSRDKLIAYLWEDSDTDKARRLLSESVYVIRKSLGEDAILATGDELRLNNAVVWSDVAEFGDALQAGDDARAVAHYHGPLLDGFFISDATEFEQWLDRERDRLAREYAATLSRLAQKSEDRLDYREAVKWWEKLCQHDPYATVPVLGLMRALDASGDRINALKYGRAHASRLHDELGAEPDPQIEAFAAELRAKPVPSTPTRVTQNTPEPIRLTPRPTGESAPASVASPAASTVFSRRWPRRVTLVLVLLAIAITAVVMQVGSRRAPAVSAKAGGLTIAILPSSAAPAVAELTNAVAQLLSTNLDGAGEVRTVDPHRLLTRLPRERAIRSPEDAARLVRLFGAQMFVLIDVVPAGSQYSITASLYENARPDSVRATRKVNGPLDNLPGMIDELSRQLLSASGHLPAERLRGVAAVTTDSYPTYKLYLQGDANFLAGSYARAVELFERAVELDPNFALAYYRLSAASEWNLDFKNARDYAASAQRLSNRLPAQQGRLIAPWRYLISGDYRNAEASYSRILGDDPNDVEALAGLAEVLVHYNPVRGVSADSALPMFDRVLAELPEFGEARFHELEFAARARDLARFDSIARRFTEPNQQRLGWAAVRAFTWGTPNGAEQELVIRQLAKADEKTVGLAAGRVAAHTHNFAAAARITRRLTQSQVKGWKAAGHILEAQLALAGNDWQTAKEHLSGAEPYERDWTRQLSALYLLHPFVSAPREKILEEIEKLRKWEPGDYDASLTFFFAVHAEVRADLRLYLLGLLNAAVDSTVQAEKYREQLADPSGVARTPAVAEFARALGQSLRAHIALARGQDSTALALLLSQSAEIRSPMEYLALSPFYSRAHDRFTIATLSARRGKRDEAIRWYGSFLDSFDFVYAAAADSALARLYTEAGNQRKADEYWAAYKRLTGAPKIDRQPVR